MHRAGTIYEEKKKSSCFSVINNNAHIIGDFWILNLFSPCESRPSTDRCSSKASPRNRVTPVLLPPTKSPADWTHLFHVSYKNAWKSNVSAQVHTDPCQWLHTRHWAALDDWASDGIRIQICLFSLLSCLSVTHPAVWRSDGCSLQPVGSCSLQETRTKHRQKCERGVVRTDCISLSDLPRKLETHKHTNKQLSAEVGPQEMLFIFSLFHVTSSSPVRCRRSQISRKYLPTHTWNRQKCTLLYNQHHLHRNHHPLMSKHHIPLGAVHGLSYLHGSRPQVVHRVAEKRQTHNPKSENPDIALFTPHTVKAYWHSVVVGDKHMPNWEEG